MCETAAINPPIPSLETTDGSFHQADGEVSRFLATVDDDTFRMHLKHTTTFTGQLVESSLEGSSPKVSHFSPADGDTTCCHQCSACLGSSSTHHPASWTDWSVHIHTAHPHPIQARNKNRLAIAIDLIYLAFKVARKWTRRREFS